MSLHFLREQYLLVDSILSRKKSFTLEGILDDLKVKCIDLTPDGVLSVLDRLQENGIIYLCGKEYEVYRH